MTSHTTMKMEKLYKKYGKSFPTLNVLFGHMT